MLSSWVLGKVAQHASWLRAAVIPAMELSTRWITSKETLDESLTT